MQAPATPRVQQLDSEGTNKRNLDFFQPEPLQTPPKLQRTISGMSEGTPKDKEEVEQQELDSILEVEVEQQVEAEQENVFDFNDYVKPGEVRKAHKGEACCLVVYDFKKTVLTSTSTRR